MEVKLDFRDLIQLFHFSLGLIFLGRAHLGPLLIFLSIHLADLLDCRLLEAVIGVIFWISTDKTGAFLLTIVPSPWLAD